MIKLAIMLVAVALVSKPTPTVYENNGFKLYFLEQETAYEMAQQMEHTKGQFTYGIIAEPIKIKDKSHAYELIKQNDYKYVIPPSGVLVFAYPGGFDFVGGP